MRRTVAVLAALLVAGVAGSSPKQEKPKQAEAPAQSFKVPPEEAKRVNPVKPTSAGLAEARRFYGYDCAMCHGKDGDGKGELAADMKLNLKDWRDPAALEGMTDGELFYVIAKGKGKMLGEETRASAEQRWHFVNLIRSFAKKEGAPKPPPKEQKEEVKPGPTSR